MSWKQRLFKPKWQNKNADIRLASVSSDHDPELIGSLLKIASDDPDSRVRTAAIKRLHQLENILNLYTHEQDDGVKAVLEDRIRQLAAATNETRPPLEQRMRVIGMTENRELIEHLAKNAPEPELRRAALEKVSRQGVLGDCSIEDSDAEIRSFAASRVTQHTTLKRVIDGLRKRDKALYSQLQQRLHLEQLEQGDPEAVDEEAIIICVELEKLALQPDGNHDKEIESLNKRWNALGKTINTTIEQRHQRAIERLTAPAPVIEKAPPKVVVETVVDVEVPKPDEIAVSAPQADEALAKLAADINSYASTNEGKVSANTVRKMRQQLGKAWKKCAPPHPDDLTCHTSAMETIEQMEAALEQIQKESEVQLEKAATILEQMEKELEDGELHKALETRAKVLALKQSHEKDRAWKPVNSRLAGMQARLRELRDWHHWSNNKIRKRLIAEMEVLPAADLHPDALLDRIKSLQTEWKTLEASEQIPGEKKFMAAPWMWRKFSEAGHKAFDTAKPFLDKRTEIQTRLADSMKQFCAELDDLINAETTDWAALNKGLGEARTKLRELGDLPYRQRQKIAKKLKSALDKGHQLVQANYELIEKEKMKLIRSASQLAHLPERSEAIDQAKALQAKWKTAGRLWRSKDQELWLQFREHLDPLFSELKEQQATIKAADNERLATQKDLCSQLKDIIKSKEELASLHGKVQGLQDAWKDIEHPDRKLQQTFQDLLDDYQKHLDKQVSREVEAARQRLWLKAELLHDLTVNGRTTKGKISKKAETKIEKDWPDGSSDDPVETGLDQARTDILKEVLLPPGDDELESMRNEARKLCISLEFVAGLPSPEEDREQRMTYQVDRLAASMSGDNPRRSVTEEAMEAEKTWLTMFALPEADFKAFGKRINTALTTINGSL